MTKHRYRQDGAAEKMRGAFYTPPNIAAALVRWAVRSPNDRVLDPACGDGVFLKATHQQLKALGNEQPTAFGIDINPQAATIANGICCDFFAWSAANPTERFDAVVGNPPFIRSHRFAEESRTLAFAQMRDMGLHPSRLMSTWAAFVALACKLLAPQGRLALVLPEELLHVHYAQALRHMLLAHFRRVVLCLPPYEMFQTVQQSVILLLCDHEPDGPGGLLELSLQELAQVPPYTAVKPAPPWTWTPKWTHLFLRPAERALMDDFFQHTDWQPLQTYGRVEVGVVTGANNFFIVNHEQSLCGKQHFVPILTGARDLLSIDHTHKDFHQLMQQGKKLFLLNTCEPEEQLPTAIRHYLKRGMDQGIHQQFKCRNRKPWYRIPSIRNAHALLLRQAGDMPRMVHLSHPCTCTDTIHRITWKEPTLSKRHVVSFLNVWTLIACELTGRSYGSGVLELMPGEANQLVMPPPIAALDGIFDEANRFMRTRQFHAVVEQVSALVAPVEMDYAQHQDALGILYTLVKRRKRTDKSL